MIEYDFISNIDREHLKRNELGANNFLELEKYNQRLIADFLYFYGKESYILPTDIEVIKSIFGEYKVLLTEILQFNPLPSETNQNLLDRRNNLIDKIKKVDKKFTASILPIYIKIKLEENDKSFQVKNDKLGKIILDGENLINTKISNFESNFNTTQKNFENTTRQFKNNFDELVTNSQKQLQDIAKIKEEAKNFNVKELVKKYGLIFSNQASNNLFYAKISLYAFIFTFALTIILVVSFFFPLLDRIENVSNNIKFNIENKNVISTTTINYIENKTDVSVTMEYLIAYIVSRLTILGFMTVLLKETLKNYNVNMHLFNLNLHRQNSLESFEMLVQNTSLGETRDLIVKEVAQTIYSNQDDGYLSGGDKKKVSLSELTDLLKVLNK